MACTAGLPLKRTAVREILEELRRELLGGGASVPAEEELCSRVLERIRSAHRCGLRRVINGTGVVLHTNLGRAPLAREAALAAAGTAMGYSTLEFDPETGRRGLRGGAVEQRLRELSGAEAALVVNNNAASVLLILSALGAGREAVVSRGELVEIGGSFRVPEIMESCGCTLREVGATNRTHLSDYARAIGDKTFALMKVHTSNFRMVGFTASVGLKDLAGLAHEHNLPLIEDMGSGFLTRVEGLDTSEFPCASDSLALGADLVCFSGDKLLGGPQAGIILGKSRYVEPLRHHPLARALRIDKMTLAALDATLALYAGESAARTVPVLRMLLASPEALRARAEELCAALGAAGVPAEPVPLEAAVGGGSAPALSLPGWGAAISPEGRGPDALGAALRGAEPPVIGRIVDNRLCLDVRTIPDEELSHVAAAVAGALA